MPPKKQAIRNKKQTKKKYTLVITNIPDGYFNTFVYWDDIWCGKFMEDYCTMDDVAQVMNSMPTVCVMKIYKCSLSHITINDEVDEILEIKMV